MPEKVLAYKSAHISVDCEENDSVDIRCGGPKYLGFDFYVDLDKVKQMEKFISSCFKKYQRPVISIHNVGESLVETLWTKEMIEECIKKYDI